MKKLVKVVFICDFCKAELATEEECQKHESECFYNSTNRYCQTCKYYKNNYCDKYNVSVVNIWCVSGRGAKEENGNINLDWENIRKINKNQMELIS